MEVDFSYPKACRLRSRYDYKRMGKHCSRYKGVFITVDARSNRSAVTRLGVTVTKKYGDAPTRNRFKRIVREAFRLSYAQLCKGLDLNVRPLQSHPAPSMQEIQGELLQFLSAKCHHS